jgi:hypothetical protein
VLVIEEPLTIRRETSLLRIPCGSDARPGDVTVVNGVILYVDVDFCV